MYHSVASVGADPQCLERTRPFSKYFSKKRQNGGVRPPSGRGVKMARSPRPIFFPTAADPSRLGNGHFSTEGKGTNQVSTGASVTRVVCSLDGIEKRQDHWGALVTN